MVGNLQHMGFWCQAAIESFLMAAFGIRRSSLTPSTKFYGQGMYHGFFSMLVILYAMSREDVVQIAWDMSAAVCPALYGASPKVMPLC